jgi:hypothetical protein
LFTTERTPIQAQPSRRAEVDENIRVQPAVNMVAGRAVTRNIPLKFAAARPYADTEAAARKLTEIALSICRYTSS